MHRFKNVRLHPPPHLQRRPPFLCAHGGDTAIHPPNTAAAIAAAAAAGADCLELDVATTADGQLISMHARDLGRLLAVRPQAATGGRSRVLEYELEELLPLRWPGGEEPLSVGNFKRATHSMHDATCQFLNVSCTPVWMPCSTGTLQHTL